MNQYRNLKKTEQSPQNQQQARQSRNKDCSHRICLECARIDSQRTRNKTVVRCKVCNQDIVVRESLEKITRQGQRSVNKKSSQHLEVDQRLFSHVHYTHPVKDSMQSRATMIINDHQNPPPFEIYQESVRQPPTGSLNQITPESKICSYHFNEKSHICLTCMRGVCIRCLQTICQRHNVMSRLKGIKLLSKEVQTLHEQRTQEAEVKMKQLIERKKVFQNSYKTVSAEIQSKFNHILEILRRKQDQILDEYVTMFRNHEAEYGALYEKIRTRLSLLEDLNGANDIGTQTSVFQDRDIETLRRHLKELGKMQQIKIHIAYRVEEGRFLNNLQMQRILFEIERLNQPIKFQTHRLNTTSGSGLKTSSSKKNKSPLQPVEKLVQRPGKGTSNCKPTHRQI